MQRKIENGGQGDAIRARGLVAWEVTQVRLQALGSNWGKRWASGEPLEVACPAKKVMFPKGRFGLGPEGPPIALQGPNDGVWPRVAIRDDSGGLGSSCTIADPLIKGPRGGGKGRLNKVKPCLPSTFPFCGKGL